MITTRHLACVLSLASVVGCYAAAADGTAGGSAPGGTTTLANAGDTGLPCDVQRVLADNCWTCHGTTPSQKAPNSLVTYADLTAVTSSKQTYAALAVDRMRDPNSPMPPGGGMSEADIAVIEKWVQGGAKQGSCTDPSAAGGPDPFASTVKCTTNTKWSGGDHESPLMHPGMACIDCHTQSGEGPSYSIAGTAYAAGHEVDDCNSTSGGATVELLDANNKVVAKAAVNSVGNFYISTRTWPKIPAGGHVRIVSSAGTRVMQDTPKSGDCNSCHTKDGTNDAPGRVVFPL